MTGSQAYRCALSLTPRCRQPLNRSSTRLRRARRRRDSCARVSSSRSSSMSPEGTPGAGSESADRTSEERGARLLEFVDALAALYADLWFEGKLDRIREESTGDDGCSDD